MGDRSPKDKQKKQKHHDKELQLKQRHKQDNMAKNRHNQEPVPGSEGQENQQFKKAG